MEDYYYFGYEYFKAVRDFLQPWSKIINIIANGCTVASALFFVSGGYATYHLSCSDVGYLKKYPNDLLLKAVTDESISSGANLLSLGGGMSTSSCDSLFEFKKRFGTDIRSVHIGKRVHNKKKYDFFCKHWENQNPDLASRYSNYFLKYRLLS